jgi:hypothetical protein
LTVLKKKFQDDILIVVVESFAEKDPVESTLQAVRIPYREPSRIFP